MNQGDDIAGTIHEVGEKVTEFKPGDRVAGFHEMVSKLMGKTLLMSETTLTLLPIAFR